jgi:TPR repeat protein
MAATMYSEGKSTAKDMARWAEWIRKAAGLGDPTGKCEYGSSMLQGTPEQKALGVKWLEESSADGCAKADTLLGVCHVQGIVGPADPAEALKWFRKGALRGDGGAANCLGFSYQIGNGVDADVVEAYKWLTIAIAEDNDPQGSANATVNLKKLVPKMTPEQIEEGKKRAAEFHPEN